VAGFGISSCELPNFTTRDAVNEGFTPLCTAPVTDGGLSAKPMKMVLVIPQLHPLLVLSSCRRVCRTKS